MCIYLGVYIYIYITFYICMYVCMYVCMFVCMYKCMYVYMYVCIYLYIYIYIHLFNRYRAFRQARDMRCVLYVICCWMCILGKVDAILGVCCEHFGVTWVYLGAILGNVRAILGLCGRSWGYLGQPWSSGFRV